MKYFYQVASNGTYSFYPIILSKRNKKQKRCPIVQVGHAWHYWQQANKEGKELLKNYRKK